MGTAGLAMASIFPGLTLWASDSGQQLSKVIIARHPNASLDLYTFDQSIVGELVNWAIAEFTGQEAPGLAWAQIIGAVSDSTVIGIKVNCANVHHCCSHPEVAYAIAEGLASMRTKSGNLSRNNIIIWDCSSDYLSNRGDYTICRGSDPNMVRCFGTDAVGYDYGAQFQVQGKTVTPSILLTTHCNYIINLSVLKNHDKAGVSLGMKNHLGSIDFPESCSGMDPDIPELNQKLRNNFSAKERLVIIDSLVGMASGGSNGSPEFIYNGLIISNDIVAADYQGRRILQENSWSGPSAATYIETADTHYGLGTSDPTSMEIVEQNPIPPATREHVDKMIRFHQEGLATALQVEWAINRHARRL